MAISTFDLCDRILSRCVFRFSLHAILNLRSNVFQFTLHQVRKLAEPVETLFIEPMQDGKLLGGVALEYESTMPTKFQVTKPLCCNCVDIAYAVSLLLTCLSNGFTFFAHSVGSFIAYGLKMWPRSTLRSSDAALVCVSAHSVFPKFFLRHVSAFEMSPVLTL
jgi:hypothetical protein